MPQIPKLLIYVFTQSLEFDELKEPLIDMQCNKLEHYLFHWQLTVFSVFSYWLHV